MKDLEQQEQVQKKSTGDANASTVDTLVSTRRQFNRGVAGVAVLLTLGNRTAWGSGDSSGSKTAATKIKEKTQKLCISQTVWESYSTGDPSTTGKKSKKFENEVANFNDFLDVDYPNTVEVDIGDKHCAVRTYTVEVPVTKYPKP